jgi:hypothetical protein
MSNDLDRQIAEARAQVEALRERAKTDPVAALALKRLEAVKADTLKTWAANHLGFKP